MKFSTSLIALVAAGLASAQLPDVPSCSLSCFLSALQSDGCSELLDFACHCQKTELVTSITPCVEKACEYKDQVSVSNAVVGQCSSAGHPISIPPIETTSASASETPSASSSAPAETTATPTGSASESSSAVESSSSAAETDSTTTGTTATGSKPVGSSSGAATSTPLVTKTDSATPSASSPAFNGAGNVKGNLAGVAALAAAAAYVL